MLERMTEAPLRRPQLAAAEAVEAVRTRAEAEAVLPASPAAARPAPRRQRPAAARAEAEPALQRTAAAAT
jgi:hypothetical protein